MNIMQVLNLLSYESNLNLLQMWHYLSFVVLIKVKDPTEFTGPESYVASLIKVRDNDWFPRMRAMSLDVNEGVEDDNNEIRRLHDDLEVTQRLVCTLSNQLAELREQVSSYDLY